MTVWALVFMLSLLSASNCAEYFESVRGSPISDIVSLEDSANNAAVPIRDKRQAPVAVENANRNNDPPPFVSPDTNEPPVVPPLAPGGASETGGTNTSSSSPVMTVAVNQTSVTARKNLTSSVVDKNNSAISTDENGQPIVPATSSPDAATSAAGPAQVSSTPKLDPGYIDVDNTHGLVELEAPEDKQFLDKNNYTVKLDPINHGYYTEKYLFHNDPEEFQKRWVNIEEVLESKGQKTFGSTNHTRLSNAYRRAASHQLTHFEFPFYGQPTRNLTIATGGFVYMGTTMHSWLAATQYIAPLMANFDTSSSPRSNILFVETEDYVAVEWREVVLRSQPKSGNFTFLVQLNKTGDILFLYKNIPVPIKSVSDQYHPLKIGVSDAYLMETPAFAFNKKVIYEYHRVEVNFTHIANFTGILIEAQKVCISLKTCGECANAKLAEFNCSWCEVSNDGEDAVRNPITKMVEASGDPPTKSFCSDEFGMHRRRQDWIHNHCDKQRTQLYCDAGAAQGGAIQPVTQPSAGASPMPPVVPGPDHDSGAKADPGKQPDTGSDTKFPQEPPKAELNAKNEPQKEAADSGTGMAPGTFIAVVCILALVITVVGWTFYAYHNPHTPSGQFLIRHRPSRWRLPGNHGDVRYTASVHM